MKRLLNRCLFAAVACLSMTTQVHAQAVPGKSAPDFSLPDVQGKTVRLSDYKGKYVVLEWLNPNCPFVRRHYEARSMQSTQSKLIESGVVWLAVNSTNPNHVDYLAPAALAQQMNSWDTKASKILMDPAGAVGRDYAARTTPQMFVIDPAGTIIYAGAIDDKRTASIEQGKNARNFVLAAFDDVRSTRAVAQASTQPYGCSVKY